MEKEEGSSAFNPDNSVGGVIAEREEEEQDGLLGALEEGTVSKEGTCEGAVLLEEMTFREVGEFLRSVHPVAILPIGSTEAHGPHLPLLTDALISREVARRAATQLQQEGVSALVLPLLSYGITNVASCFPGTITIKQETLLHVIEDVCISAAEQGFHTICLCNCHLEPAHIETLHKAARLVETEAQVRVIVPDMREPEWAQTLTDEFRKGCRHAGAFETSLVMSARPALVRTEITKDLPPVWINLGSKMKAGASSFIEAGAEQAYLGDPRSATVEEGEICYDALARMVAVSVKRLLGG